MSQKHEMIVQQVQKNWSIHERGRLFKNHNGLAYVGRKAFEFKDGHKTMKILNALPIKYGLQNGSSDLIGIEFFQMCRYMPKLKLTWKCYYCENPKNKECPWKIPIFCSVEVKTKAYPHLQDHQKDWLDFVIMSNGAGYVAMEDGSSYNLTEWKNNK